MCSTRSPARAQRPAPALAIPAQALRALSLPSMQPSQHGRTSTQIHVSHEKSRKGRPIAPGKGKTDSARGRRRITAIARTCRVRLHGRLAATTAHRRSCYFRRATNSTQTFADPRRKTKNRPPTPRNHPKRAHTRPGAATTNRSAAHRPFGPQTRDSPRLRRQPTRPAESSHRQKRRSARETAAEAADRRQRPHKVRDAHETACPLFTVVRQRPPARDR